jgi:hypothetical protein
MPVQAQMSTTGKEFWVGFMENNRSLPATPDFAVILVTATENTTGVIEYLGKADPFTLTVGQQYIFRLNSADLDLLHRSSGVIENLGIHITASGKIAVHAINERYRSADGTVVLPVTALGKDHYITSHFEVNPLPNLNTSNESTLLVVATEDKTRIEITTTENSISGNVKGVPTEIVLNRGQSYQIKARGDLTGSRVRVVGDNANDCKKIAVYGGNKWTSVGACGNANDHLYQWDSSRDYNPLGQLEKIKATVLAINSADDERNPPELGVMEKVLKRIPNSRLLLIPASDQTAGHGTTGQAKWWKSEVEALLKTAPRLSR